MLPNEIQNYLNEAKQFLIDYHGFLQSQINGTPEGQAASNYVSQGIAIGGQANVKSALVKLDELQQASPAKGWFSKVAPQWLKKFFTRPKNAADILVEEVRHQKTIRIITTQLHRAQEFIKELNFNSTMSAQFIPVPPHIEQAKKSTALLEQVEAILLRHQALISQVSLSTLGKSWYDAKMRMGSYLVGIRVAAHGLFSVSPKIGIPNKIDQDKALEYLQKLERKIDVLELEDDNSHTKTTARFASNEHRYIPSEIKTALWRFTQLMQNTDEPLTKERVLEAVKVNFPRPA